MIFFVNFQSIVFQGIYLILKQKFHLFKFFNFTWFDVGYGQNQYQVTGFYLVVELGGIPATNQKIGLSRKIDFKLNFSHSVHVLYQSVFSWVSLQKNKLINLYQKLISYFKTESTFGLNILIFRKPSYLS